MEYMYLGIFLIVFCFIILAIDNFKIYTVITYVFGAVTSVVSGYIGMHVATRANVRVTFEALINEKNDDKYVKPFNVAFKGGCVMGFCLVSLALFILTLLIIGITSNYF